MARKKDLGGLAALAGLAYMASRDKAAKGNTPVEDAKPTATGFMNEKEPGWDSKGSEFGTEKEPGWESGTAPARKPAAPAARRTPAGGGGLENARDAILSRQGRANSTTPEGMANYRSRAGVRSTDDTANPDVKQYRDDTYDPKVRRGMNKENLDATGETFKKGGSVKGWGIARGSRKAKTY